MAPSAAAFDTTAWTGLSFAEALNRAAVWLVQSAAISDPINHHKAR